MIDPKSISYLREDEGAIAPHLFRVTFHYFEVCSDGLGKVRFVDDQQVGLGDARPALAGDFVTARDIDNLDGVIGEFATEASSEVIPSGFEEEKIGFEFAMKFFQSQKIGGNIFANSSVRTATRFDRTNAFCGKSLVVDQKFAVFLGEDVIGDRGQAELVAQAQAKLKHQCGLAASDRPADANGKCALGKIALDRQIAIVEVTGMVQVVMCVVMRTMFVTVEMMLVMHKFSFGIAGNKDGLASPRKDRGAERFAKHRRW